MYTLTLTSTELAVVTAALLDAALKARLYGVDDTLRGLLNKVTEAQASTTVKGEG